MSDTIENHQLEDEIPSREDVIKFYKEQNEILELRKESARLQAEIAQYEADRFENIAKLAHYQGMMAKQQAEGETSETSETEAKRSLKKDK